MARLNIDYSAICVDPRFRALGQRLGGEGQAWVVLLRFWELAQKYWGKEELVPKKVFDLDKDFQTLIEVDLAEPREQGIYARGSEEHFAWYLSKCRASRRGVLARLELAKKEPIGQPIAQPIGQPAVVNPLTLALVPVKENICKPSTPPPPDASGGTPKNFSDFEISFAQEWVEFAQSVLPNLKPRPKVWAKTVRQLMALDGFTETQLRDVLAFVRHDDSFWRDNAVSLEGLRKPSKNGLKKIQNIVLAMGREKTMVAATDTPTVSKSKNNLGTL